MKLYLFLFAFFMAAVGFAQDTLSNYRTKKAVITDTVVVDSFSINPSRFRVLDKTGSVIDSLSYTVDYENGTVVFSEEMQQAQDSVTIEYLRYPLFLTREYYTCLLYTSDAADE